MTNNWIEKTLDKNGVLKNKQGIKDSATLAELEYKISAKVALRLLERNMKINSIEDLKKIHKLMFGALYNWAGKEREGDFSKGNTTFFPHDRFAFARQDINNFLTSKAGNNPLKAQDYAVLLDKINYYHPFREGNGRSSKTFIQLFALQHHQIIDYPRYDQGMIKALSEANVSQISSYIKVQDSTTLKIAKEETVNKYKEQYKQYLAQHGLNR